MIALPEHYALNEEIMIKPINHLDSKTIKARLASITCDCDDIYFDSDKGYIDLPIKDDKRKVFVGLIGTGSYQNSMNGKGGVHHCLLPEERDLVIYTENNLLHILERNNLQSIDKIKEILKFDLKKEVSV